MIAKDKHYCYKGNEYVVVGFTKMKSTLDGTWVEAVQYKRATEVDDPNVEPFTREKSDFEYKFIPAKRPHRLHNHPRMEVELGLNEREVIVDQEFVHLFRNAYPVRGRRREVGVDHFIVSKKEFLERMEESRGGGNR